MTPSITAALVSALEAIIDDRIARVLGAATSDVYTSTSLPRATSRRTFRETCASGRVVGAVKNGKEWSCPRAAWHTARSHRAPTLRVVATSTDAEIANAALLAAGLRATRRVAS